MIEIEMAHQGVKSEGPAEYLYKILVVGDIGTGKTAIIRRTVEGQFSESYKTTIGVDFALKTIQKSNNTIHLQLWYALSTLVCCSACNSILFVYFILFIFFPPPCALIRDIAGQERYGNLTRVYYKEAVGAFVVFDLTRNSSFEAVKRWKEDIDNVC